MIYIFIIIVLYLLIYQIYHIITEGLDEEESQDPSSLEDTNPSEDNTDKQNTGTTASDKEGTDKPIKELKLDLCKNNNSYSTLSLTDKNLLFLNDRINILNNNYMDLSMNVIKLENQLKDNAVKSEGEAKDLVGDTPITVNSPTE